VEWRRLESDATVRHHLAWDWQCFDASFFARNACSVSRSSACTAHASYKEYQLKTHVKCHTFKAQGEGQAKALKEISVQIEALKTQGEEQAKALKDALKAQGEEQAKALNDILSAQTAVLTQLVSDLHVLPKIRRAPLLEGAPCRISCARQSRA